MSSYPNGEALTFTPFAALPVAADGYMFDAKGYIIDHHADAVKALDGAFLPHEIARK